VLAAACAAAAGLPLLPGLITRADVASGAINHAIRFTMHASNDAYAYPASHKAGCERLGVALGDAAACCSPPHET
jgi:hypothetical protein